MHPVLCAAFFAMVPAPRLSRRKSSRICHHHLGLLDGTPAPAARLPQRMRMARSSYFPAAPASIPCCAAVAQVHRQAAVTGTAGGGAAAGASRPGHLLSSRARRDRAHPCERGGGGQRDLAQHALARSINVIPGARAEGRFGIHSFRAIGSPCHHCDVPNGRTPSLL